MQLTELTNTGNVFFVAAILGNLSQGEMWVSFLPRLHSGVLSLASSFQTCWDACCKHLPDNCNMMITLLVCVSGCVVWSHAFITKCNTCNQKVVSCFLARPQFTHFSYNLLFTVLSEDFCLGAVVSSVTGSLNSGSCIAKMYELTAELAGTWG